MESMHNRGSNVDMRTDPSTNSSEGEQFNKEKKQVPSSSPLSSDFTSQDPVDFMPNAKIITTTHSKALGANDQIYLQPELHNTHSVSEKGDERPTSTHLEAHSTNPFGEAFPSSLANNTAPSSSSSQNPIQMMSDDATNVGAFESEKGHDHLHSLPAMQRQNGGSGMTNNNLSTYPADEGRFSSLAPSTYESSQANLFEVPTSENNKNTYLGLADLVKVDEHHDHGNKSHHNTLPPSEQQDWSMPSNEARTHQSNTHGETHDPSSTQQLDPLFTSESAQNQRADAPSKNHAGAATTTSTDFQQHNTFSDTEQEHHSKTCSNSGTDKKLGSSVSSFSQASESSTQDHYSASAATKPPQKQGNDFMLGSESNDDDIPLSSFPKHGQQSSDNGARQYSSVPLAPGTSNGPPLQVMEHPGDPTTSSNYKFPSHVFDRHKSKSNTQWSAASNESLFSIQMGSTSFSSEVAWMNKSGDMEKIGDINSSSTGTFQSNQPPLPLPPQPQPKPQPQPQPQHQPQPQQPQPQSQSQPPSTKFNDISQSTAKQHEGSRVTEEKAAETMREVIMESNVNKENGLSKGDLIADSGATGSNGLSNFNARSHHSDASTKSFAFNVLTDGDKPSLKHDEDKRKQQKMAEQESLKATPDVAAAQNPKPTPNAPQKKSWLSCFSCC